MIKIGKCELDISKIGSELRRTTPSKIIAALTAIILLGFLVIIIYYPKNFAQSSEIRIQSGSSLSKIAQTLKDSGIIRSKILFEGYVIARGDDKNLKAGRYIFSGNVNLYDLVNKISKGLAEPDDIRVFIPEGVNIWEVDRILINAGLANEGEFANNYYKSEGTFFPDTYLFPADKLVTLGDIADKLKSNFDDKLDVYKSRPDFKKKIIIASILEKEGRTEDDMKIIAGIIEKRLKMKHALQLDATVSYGACLRISIKNNWIKDCSANLIGVASEIKIDSEFNSYTRLGLPPRPISNPGIAAIEAAFNPTISPYLYYLSTRDGSQIIFSKTAAEHIANRKKYLGL